MGVDETDIPEDGKEHSLGGVGAQRGGVEVGETGALTPSPDAGVDPALDAVVQQHLGREVRLRLVADGQPDAEQVRRLARRCRRLEAAPHPGRTHPVPALGDAQEDAGGGGRGRVGEEEEEKEEKAGQGR